MLRFPVGTPALVGVGEGEPLVELARRRTINGATQRVPAWTLALAPLQIAGRSCRTTCLPSISLCVAARSPSSCFAATLPPPRQQYHAIDTRRQAGQHDRSPLDAMLHLARALAIFDEERAREEGAEEAPCGLALRNRRQE